MSAALIVLMLAAQGPAPEHYRAVGVSPLWNVRIDSGRMVFETPGRPVVRVAAPRRQETEIGFAHWTRDFAVSVEHANCTDLLTRRLYADRVTVRLGETEFEGCGGRVLSPALTPPYEAGGSEPLWWVEIAHGRLAFQVDEQVTIVPLPASRSTRDGRLRAYQARGLGVAIRRQRCESDDGRAYADTVTVTARGRTFRGCGGARMRVAPDRAGADEREGPVTAVLFLLAMATTTAGAAQPRAAMPYEAGGFEPNWVLRLERGRLHFDSGVAGVRPIDVPLPRRQPVRNGYRYVTPGLTVTVRHGRCESYSGRLFADTVYISGRAEPGCGGRPLAPPTLTATAWDLGGVGGARYRHGEVNLHFAYDGVLRGNAGCSDFTVPFTERRPFLRFGRMSVSRRNCGTLGLGAERERRALAIFTGTARIGFVDGDTLILTGRHGTARLVP